MQPSVGRIVLFFHPGDGITEPQPAVISRVWSESCVNLRIMKDASPDVPLATSVPLFAPLTPEQRAGLGQQSPWCEWPQLQKAPAVQTTPIIESWLDQNSAAVCQVGDALERLLVGICSDTEMARRDSLAILRPNGPVMGTAVARSTVSIDTIAGTIHENWRKERDRSYSPFNKPWAELSQDDRRQISRQAATALAMAKEAGADISVIDEYA